jgi:hypothetical protein
VILTGNFEQDYTEACRKQNVKAFTLLKFGLPLPPLPFNFESKTDVEDKEKTLYVLKDKNGLAPILPFGSKSSNGNLNKLNTLPKDQLNQGHKQKGTGAGAKSNLAKGSTVNLKASVNNLAESKVLLN